MKLFAIVVSTFIISGCMLSAPTQSNRVKEKSLLGCYLSTQASQYDDIKLELKPDGTYSSIMRGDIGPWGTSIGKWRLENNRIVFAETLGNERMKEYFTSLIVGRRWPYKVLGRNDAEIKTGWTDGWSVFYLSACDV